MKNFSRTWLLWFSLGLGLLMFCASCDGPFPTQDKIGPPDDHTSKQGNAYHKPGYEHPFNSNSGCTDCHQPDLRGGIAEVDGEERIAPSCYQCHGEKWDDD